MTKLSHTRSSFYRRVLVTHLIDNGYNTVPTILKETQWPKRTLQGTLASLAEINIELVCSGGTVNKTYEIKSWGMLDKNTVKERLPDIKQALGIE